MDVREKLKRILKSNKFLLLIYHYTFSILLNFLGLFIKTDDKLVLFVVYGGQRYDDSPKFIYEYLKNQYYDLKFKWAFIDPENINGIVPDEEKIKIDTFQYYLTALKAGYWVTNSSVSRSLAFKKKKTKNIFFTHGMTGIKKIGLDIHEQQNSFNSGFTENFDYIFIEGSKETEILTRAWNKPVDNFIAMGLPRNDELLSYSEEYRQKLRKELGIPVGKKAILYAPTFREYLKDSDLAAYLKPPIDFDYWYEQLKDDYVLIITAHYEVAKLMNIPKIDGFIINAFKYPNINDLMIASDLLVSDYSSIIFDYSLMEKPIFSFDYDYDEYSERRGLYPGYSLLFYNGIIKKQEQLLEFIVKGDYELNREYVKTKIKEEYFAAYGNTTEKIVKFIFGEITG